MRIGVDNERQELSTCPSTLYLLFTSIKRKLLVLALEFVSIHRVSCIQKQVSFHARKRSVLAASGLRRVEFL